MAKLFNNIRKKLVSEKPSVNRTANYLKYAIGEIVLVVIGILIALSINTWNEKRLLKKKEIILVTQLLEDAKADSIFFNSRVQLFKSQISSYNYLSSLCNNTLQDSLPNKFTNEIGPFIIAGYQSNLIINNPDAYTILSNAVLKRKIRIYQAKYDFVKLSIIYYNDRTKSYSSPIYLKYYKLFEEMANNEAFNLDTFKPLCNYKDILGVYSNLKGLSINVLDQIEPFLKVNSALIDDLKSYLNKN